MIIRKFLLEIVGSGLSVKIPSIHFQAFIASVRMLQVKLAVKGIHDTLLKENTFPVDKQVGLVYYIIIYGADLSKFVII